MLELETLHLTKQILTHDIKNNNAPTTKSACKNEIYNELKCSTGVLETSVNLCVTFESWKDENDTISWLNEVEKSPAVFVKRIINFLLGLFISDYKQVEVNIKCLQILMDCFKKFPNLTNNLLALVLFKLSKTTNSKLHFELLKALPEFATKKENVQLVALTLQSLTGNFGELHVFVMQLLLELWEKDSRCYDYLEKVLIHEPQVFVWEYYVVKAEILKQICVKR